MIKGIRTETVLAALLVLILGSVVSFAEVQTLKLKVKKGGAETVEVDHNGAVEVIELEDLADGEERSFTAGEHSITVRRDGDELIVKMDGEDLAGVHTVVGDGKANMVWVSDGNEKKIDVFSDKELKGKRVIMIGDEGGEGEHKIIKIKCEGDETDCDHLETIDIETIVKGELDPEALVKGIGEEHIMLHVDSTVQGHHGEPLVIKSRGGAMTRYRCPEDATMLVIDKEKATQEHYLCPVCGREMEKLDAPEMKVMTFVTKAEVEEKPAD
jgi:hypothetical protein